VSYNRRTTTTTTTTKHASLAQENGFGPSSFAHFARGWYKAQQSLTPDRGVYLK